MYQKSGSKAWRWLAVVLLAVSAIPIGMAWRSAGSAASSATKPLDWPEVNGQAWADPSEIEVQLKPGEGDDVLADLGKKIGTPLTFESQAAREEEIADLTLPAGQSPDADLNALRSDSRVETADIVHFYDEPETMTSQSPDPTPSAEPPAEDTNRWKPNDPRYNEQWNFRMVKAEEAWEVTKGKGVVVAVIDTGVAYADTKKGKQARDFGDTSFTKGYDFISRDGMPNDDNGHGTHVAGTIAESTDNNEGVAGLAFEATIMPLKVLSASGGGRSDVIAEAIRWAADHGANVINMSLGGPFPDKVMQSACEYAHQKGVTIVCAAGNSGREGVGYPAAFKDCIAVSSVGPDGELAFYSTWGKEIAVAAPGGDKQKGGDAGGILQNTVFSDENGNLVDDYYAFQGTSMASPHVAAVAALIESKGIKDPDDVRCILQKSAQKQGPRNKYGAGIVDAGAAAKLAANIYDDGVARFWFVLGLFAGCIAIGRLRQKSGSNLGYPFWGTAALSLGLLLPDWLTGYLGVCSHLNLIGHSVLIPGALLLMGAEGKTEKRLLGWMALGFTLHLGWEFLRGTALIGPEVGTWQMLPWVASNVLVGFGLLIAGLTASRD
ncbi:MAG TPA: S8 family peptidase [Chthonomonadaceae bacterium]|nr:S8 family peptidase [Chthonomonadaceae bacterium]